jgi:hypothetical protein
VFTYPSATAPSVLDRLIVEVSISHTLRHTHTHTHTQPIGFLWASNQPVASATYTTHNKYNRRNDDSRKEAISDLRLKPHGH